MRTNRFAEAESFKQNGRMESQGEEYIFRLSESPRWKRYFWYFRGQQYLRRFPSPSYVCILLNAVCAPGGKKRKREDIRKNERETNSLEGSWNSPSQAAKRKTSSSFTVRILCICVRKSKTSARIPTRSDVFLPTTSISSCSFLHMHPRIPGHLDICIGTRRRQCRLARRSRALLHRWTLRNFKKLPGYPQTYVHGRFVDSKFLH